jgi:hypothetical protein
MRPLLPRLVFISAVGFMALGGVACSANIHDNTVNVDAQLDFKVDSTVNVDQVKPGESVAVNMSAKGAVLVDPNSTPAPADVATAAYFKVFIDDTNGTPLVVTAQASASVKIPEATPSGKHHLICQLFKHDGTPTDQEQTVDITVSASATVTVGAKDGG